MKLSVVLPARNRVPFLKRTLEGYSLQTLCPEDWEVILVDDTSNQDLSVAYTHLLGRLNLTHVRISHARHPLFLELNPGWKEEAASENWYHTPAISTNIGIAFAQGRHLCLSHPEIVHAPANFEIATRLLDAREEHLFGMPARGTRATSEYLDRHAGGRRWAWNELVKTTQAESRVIPGKSTLYRSTSFLPRSVAVSVGGIDFAYLRGISAEEDDFQERIARAGCRPRTTSEIQSLHQDLSDETERLPRRDSKEWRDALERNRGLFAGRRLNGFPRRANEGTDWAARDCVVSFRRFGLSASSPRATQTQEVP